jgi:uncharacterized membrane protein
MSGNWVMTLGECTDPIHEFCAQTYLVEVALKSKLTMDVFLGLAVEDRIVGRPMPILVSLSDNRPIPGATVRVQITDPYDAVWNLTLYDDGLHGDGGTGDGFYANTFYQTFRAGSYIAVITAEGTSTLAGDFRRRLRASFNMDRVTDSDEDGMPDWWETGRCTDPKKSDAQEDPDQDGLSNLDEYRLGTDPCNPDTDNGGESDGSEVRRQADPLDPRDDRIARPRARAWPGVGLVWVRFTVKPEYDHMLIYRSLYPNRGFSLVASEVRPTGEWIDQNVDNGTEYCYRVVAVGQAGQESGASNTTCATPKRDPIPPTGWILINDGAPSTAFLDAQLTLWAVDNPVEEASEHPGAPPRPTNAHASGVTEMMLSNEGSLAGAVWEPYQTSKPWRLASQNDLATVYVKYRDAAGNESETFHASIQVVELLCRANKKLDLVWVLDTGPDMESYLDNVCRAIPATVQSLQDMGLEVRSTVLGITQNRACANQNVRDLLKTVASNHPSDWGPAVSDVAGHFKWQAEVARLIVPISNVGPEDGNPVDDPGPDRDAINAAIASANQMRVSVLPLIMPPQEAQYTQAILKLADDLAKATGGTVMRWGDPDLNITQTLLAAHSRNACVPHVRGVSPMCGIDETTTLVAFGRNLEAGLQVLVGGQPARDVAVNTDRTRVSFKIPLGLASGRTYDLRVELPGIVGSTLPGAITVGPCSNRCDGFTADDIHPPMWDLWDGEMEFQALASGSSLTARLYANGTAITLAAFDLGGTPLGSTIVADGATGEIGIPTVAGNIYRLRVSANRTGLAHFRLLTHGATWLRIPDDGDNWSGGVNPGPGENHGAESNPELGFDERWTEVGPQFATTVWYFNVLPGTNRLAVRVWGEWPYGDGHAGMEWVDPSGVVIPLVGPEGPMFDHTWTVANPAPGFWGLRLKADPPFSPWAQHYSLARLDVSNDDWLYLRTGSLAGPPCGPSVTLDPPEGNICLDKIFRLDIVIADVANLYGAEVHLTFDSARLEVVDAAGNPTYEIVPGPFLDPTQGLIGMNSADNVGGYIDYAISLRDPAPPAFGTGVLATVYFRPKATGTTTVSFDEVKLSEKPEPPAPAARIPADFRDATFEINDCRQAQIGALKGRVFLDGRLNHSGAKVSAEPGGHEVLTLPDGGFELSALPAGNYTVDVRKTSYLRAGDRNFTATGGSTLALPNVMLLGGDCNNNDTIDITDGAIASASFGFGTGQVGFDARADINGDGVVDIFDLVMVGNNFGCSVTDPTARCQRWNRP